MRAAPRGAVARPVVAGRASRAASALGLAGVLVVRPSLAALRGRGPRSVGVAQLALLEVVEPTALFAQQIELVGALLVLRGGGIGSMRRLRGAARLVRAGRLAAEEALEEAHRGAVG